MHPAQLPSTAARSSARSIWADAGLPTSPPGAALLAVVISRAYRPGQEFTLPGLATVLRAIITIYPETESAIGPVAFILQPTGRPDRRPRLADGPIAAFLFAAFRGGHGLPPVPTDRLRQDGPVALSALYDLVAASPDRAASYVFPLRLVLTADGVAIDDAPAIQALLDSRYPIAATYEGRRRLIEQLTAAMRRPLKLEHRIVVTERPTPVATSGAGPSAALREEMRRAKIFGRRSPHETRGHRRPRPSRSGTSSLVEALQRDAGLWSRTLPSVQHLADLFAQCNVRWIAGRIDGPPEDIVTLAELALPIMHLGRAKGPVLALTDGAPPSVGASGVLDVSTGQMRLPLDRAIVTALKLQSGSWWMHPSEPRVAGNVRIACWATQDLLPAELALWRARLDLPEGTSSRLSELRLAEYAGARVALTSLRPAGRALALSCDVEPSWIGLGGGPTAIGDDVQIAYESRPVRDLSIQLARVRAQVASKLMDGLPSSVATHLIACGHVLPAWAETPVPAMHAPESSLDLVGTRQVVDPHLPMDLVTAAANSLAGVSSGPPETAALTRALITDLLVNYGIRSEVLPQMLWRHVHLADATVFVVGKTGPGGTVDGTLPLDRETLAIVRRLIQLRADALPSHPLLTIPDGTPLTVRTLWRGLHLPQTMAPFRLRSCRQALVARLLAAGVPQRRRRAILHHFDPLWTPYQPWSGRWDAEPEIREALAAVRLPFGLNLYDN